MWQQFGYDSQKTVLTYNTTDNKNHTNKSDKDANIKDKKKV